MKIYTNWAFLRPVNTSLHGDFTIENPSFSMYLLSTQEHTIPLCVKILQILFWLELSWFWIERNGFWLFMYHCVVKSSVCIGAISKHTVPHCKPLQQFGKKVLSKIMFLSSIMNILIGFLIFQVNKSLILEYKS